MFPKQVGRYKIMALLGQRAMGRVYRAYDPDLNREVALKVIDFPGENRAHEWLQRFRQEVQAAARLKHPHIVTVYDVV